jgi:hypothetical protein
MLTWMRSKGKLSQVGVEGTGAYGQGWPATCTSNPLRNSKFPDLTDGFAANAARVIRGPSGLGWVGSIRSLWFTAVIV